MGVALEPFARKHGPCGCFSSIGSPRSAILWWWQPPQEGGHSVRYQRVGRTRSRCQKVLELAGLVLQAGRVGAPGSSWATRPIMWVLCQPLLMLMLLLAVMKRSP